MVVPFLFIMFIRMVGFEIGRKLRSKIGSLSIAREKDQKNLNKVPMRDKDKIKRGNR